MLYFVNQVSQEVICDEFNDQQILLPLNGTGVDHKFRVICGREKAEWNVLPKMDKMKTKTTIKTGMAIILLSMLSVPAFSQIRFGVKADVGLNNPSFSSDALKVENMTSYSIGPSIEAMFLPLGVGTLGIEASLLYNDNRMTIARLSGEGTAADRDVSNRYLILPVNAKLKFGTGMLPLRLYAAAGPYAGYLIQGDEIDLGQTADQIKAKEFQAGVNLGLGFEVFNMIQVGVNYRVQLTDNYSMDEPDWGDPLNGKSEIWSITGAIYF